jgi:hypothetical protein
MSQTKVYREKDVESSTHDESVAHHSTPGWKGKVRNIERVLGIEAQGISRVHEGEHSGCG